MYSYLLCDDVIQLMSQIGNVYAGEDPAIDPSVETLITIYLPSSSSNPLRPATHTARQFTTS